MKIFFDKWNLLEKLLDEGIKPTNDKFKSSVVELFRGKIAEEVELRDVSPETFGIVEQKAHDFKNQMKQMSFTPDLPLTRYSLASIFVYFVFLLPFISVD